MRVPCSGGLLLLPCHLVTLAEIELWQGPWVNLVGGRWTCKLWPLWALQAQGRRKLKCYQNNDKCRCQAAPILTNTQDFRDFAPRAVFPICREASRQWCRGGKYWHPATVRLWKSSTDVRRHRSNKSKSTKTRTLLKKGRMHMHVKKPDWIDLPADILKAWRDYFRRVPSTVFPHNQYSAFQRAWRCAINHGGCPVRCTDANAKTSKS